MKRPNHLLFFAFTSLVCLPARAQLTLPAAPYFNTLPPLSVGKLAQVNQIMVACPTRGNVSIYMYSVRNARLSHDSSAEQEALTEAVEDGCRQLNPGDRGVVIAFFGMLKGWAQLRMSDDNETYWTVRAGLGDASKESSWGNWSPTN